MHPAVSAAGVEVVALTSRGAAVRVDAATGAIVTAEVDDDADKLGEDDEKDKLGEDDEKDKLIEDVSELGEDEARGAVRVSLGWSTTPDEVEEFLDRFPEVVDQVRDGMSQPAS